MIKFMIAFGKSQNPAVFENAYNDLLALVERMPNITRRQVVSILGSPLGEPPFERILEVYFDDMDTFQASLRSKAGQEAGSELGRRFPRGTYQTLYAEVYEETGGRTPVQQPNSTTP